MPDDAELLNFVGESFWKSSMRVAVMDSVRVIVATFQLTICHLRFTITDQLLQGIQTKLFPYSSSLTDYSKQEKMAIPLNDLYTKSNPTLLLCCIQMSERSRLPAAAAIAKYNPVPDSHVAALLTWIQ